jgi:hypothetical protein
MRSTGLKDNCGASGTPTSSGIGSCRPAVPLKTSRDDPTRKMYIVSAHMDGRGGGEAADDDASGCAVVLELARVLGMPDVRTNRSVRIVHHFGCHAPGYAVEIGGVGRLMEQLQRIETQHHQVHPRLVLASVDQPVVLGVKLRHVTHAGPSAAVVAAQPGAVHGNRIARPASDGGLAPGSPERVSIA